ncbi:MAG: FAD-binding oxidoreductase [Rhodobacteraceae bacterium]|nr:FAD-binding oxidoreductase [Paracoccaceae bacterium]MCY4249189.1 FAD-binding oxidoreductase [Paracoccaceae bacterium]
MTNSHKKQIIVVGSGIAGVSTALWLQRFGENVTLMDRSAPGEGTSFGNAGVLAACSITPVTAPKMVSKLPGYLLNPNFPLYVIWEKLPYIVPFLVRYLLHANDADTRRISRGLTEIVADSIMQHRDLAHGTKAEKWLHDSKYIFAYESRKAFENDGYVWSIRTGAGFEPQIVEGQEVKEILPGTGNNINLLAVMDSHGFITNPGQYVKDLAMTFREQGGTFIKAQVKDFSKSGDKISSVETDQGSFDCTDLVITAGIWSKDLMRKLGVNVPMESERGYHILLRSPSTMPPCPIMVASGKFVMTPMAMGLRCAGILEFGGLTAPPSKKPLQIIKRHVRSTYPELEWEDTEEWLGHRPAPCDSLPFIGQVGESRIYTGFGHHHIGLTSGPKTGRILAELIANNQFMIDISPYFPRRFS